MWVVSPHFTSLHIRVLVPRSEANFGLGGCAASSVSTNCGPASANAGGEVS